MESSKSGTTSPSPASLPSTTTELDQIVVGKMRTAQRASRGFVLDLAESAGLVPAAEGQSDQGGTGSRRGLEIKLTEVLRPIDEYESPTAWRNHAIEDADSFVVYAKKYGNASKSLVVYNDNDVVLSIDEQVSHGKRERATLTFAYSPDWKAWLDVFAKPSLDHRTLLKHLLLFQHNMVDVALLDSMRSIKATATVKQNSDLRNEVNQVGVIFEAAAGEDLINFPKKFEIKVPVLDIDVPTEGMWKKVLVRVEVQLPTDANKLVAFQLIAPTMNSVRRVRVNEECGKIREQLSEWTVVRGKHGELPREVGRPDPE